MSVRLASLPSLGALAMLVSAPAVASTDHDGLVEICTAQGAAWVDIPGAPALPQRHDHQIACAHATCPRGSDLRRKARTDPNE